METSIDFASKLLGISSSFSGATGGHLACLILHLVGIVVLFAGFIVGGKEWGKKASMLHGIGLLLILVSGMGMIMGPPKAGFAPWIFIKLFAWIAFGGSLTLFKRKALPPVASWAIVIGFGLIALWTVYIGRFSISFLQ